MLDHRNNNKHFMIIIIIIIIIANLNIIIPVIVANPSPSSIKNDNNNNNHHHHEKQTIFELDSINEIPIKRSKYFNENLIKRNHTMISLCQHVQKEDQNRCILSIEIMFENMFTALYLDYVNDLDKFIQNDGFDLLYIEGGSSKFFNSLKFKQRIMYNVLWEHLKKGNNNNINNDIIDGNNKLQFCET